MENKKGNVTIDRLNIRLKGVPAHTARAVVEQLGSRLLKQLARDETFSRQGQHRRIDRVDAGTHQLQSGESKNPAGLQARIVSQIARSIHGKI